MFYLIDQAKLDVVIIDAKMLQGDLDLSNYNSVKKICIYGQTKWKVILRNKITENLSNLNRYRRGLETCPQAKTSKSGREYFRLGTESYSSLGRVGKKRRNERVHFWTFSPVDKFRVLACIG